MLLEEYMKNRRNSPSPSRRKKEKDRDRDRFHSNLAEALNLEESSIDRSSEEIKLSLKSVNVGFLS